jgi:murein DD-endopeptidase MepM/ murein hydrolase activator NlpD
VFPGVVSLITYMSGFGNTIIVDHNNSYYTVYTHLNDVFVTKFQFLETGQVIGLVGDSGSLEGAMLHFEIYGGNKPLNPISWLKK